MIKKQDGFAVQAVVLLLTVVVLLVGAGYVVMRRQNKESDSVSTTSANTQVQQIVPVDGTPKSVAAEINNQVASEVKLDDYSMQEEESESKLDDSIVKEVEDAANEKNL